MSLFIDHNNTEEPKTSRLSCIDNYEFHRSLGKGSMGKVKLGVHIITGEKVNTKKNDNYTASLIAIFRWL